MAKTLRELADEKFELFRDLDSMAPLEVARQVVELSSLWAGVNKELLTRELWYHEKMKQCVIEHGTVAKATVFAKTSQEYKDFLEASAYSKSIMEVVRTAKRFISLNEQILRESRY